LADTHKQKLFSHNIKDYAMNFSFLILRSPEVCSLGTNIFSRLLKKRAAKKPGPGLDRQDPLKGKAVSSEDLKTRKISRNLKENKEYLVGILGRNVDLVTREINPGGVNRTIWLVYLETLADNNGISESILKPLMLEQFIGEIERPDADFIELIENSIITAPQIRSKVYTMDDVTDAVMSGCLLRKTGYGDDTSIYLPLYPEQSAAFPFIQPPGHPIAFKHCRAAHFYQHAECFRALFLSIAVRLSGKLFPYLGFIGFYLDSHGINISPVTLQVFQEVPELNIGIKRT
jgi:hypothetical protein